MAGFLTGLSALVTANSISKATNAFTGNSSNGNNNANGSKNYFWWVVLGALLLWLLVRYINRKRKERELNSVGDLGSPADYATRLFMAFQNDNPFGFGTNESAVFQVATDMAYNKVSFDKVAKSYQLLYDKNLISEMNFGELTIPEYQKFLAIVQGRQTTNIEPSKQATVRVPNDDLDVGMYAYANANNVPVRDYSAANRGKILGYGGITIFAGADYGHTLLGKVVGSYKFVKDGTTYFYYRIAVNKKAGGTHECYVAYKLVQLKNGKDLQALWNTLTI